MNIEIKERGKKMFREMLVAQYERNTERYEIETDTEEVLEVWDREMYKSFEFRFDKEGNLIEIY